jgi:arylsulfatase A-like enzyme
MARLRIQGLFLIALGAVTPMSMSHAGKTAESSARPNVVFILVDDLGFMDLGCNNPATFYETPHIDRLAARGMRFTAGYAACPVCSPTRASIMTGKYPPRTGITDFIGGNRSGRLRPAPNQDHLALEEVTLAEALRAAGYATFFAGKWHLGAGAYGPNAQGFGPGLTGAGQFYYPSEDPPPAPQSKSKSDDDPKTTDRIADAAVRFITANRDRPFFAYLPFLAVHIPIGARRDLIEKYRHKRASAPDDAWGMEHRSRVRLVQNDPVYAAMLEHLDAAIGRVLAELDRAGVEARTIVVFTSDNGGLATAEGHPTSNRPLRAGKGWLYEGGIRVPWIIYAPGVTRPGSVCATPVLSTDFYPTILELAGLPLAPNQQVDGKSLVPLLAGRDQDRGPLFWHYPHYGNQGGSPAGAVRDGDWKLIEWYEDGRHELYNLRDDPSEQHDLAARHSAKAESLHAQLAAWRTSVKAVLPTPIADPDYGSRGRARNQRPATARPREE